MVLQSRHLVKLVFNVSIIPINDTLQAMKRCDTAHYSSMIAFCSVSQIRMTVDYVVYPSVPEHTFMSAYHIV